MTYFVKIDDGTRDVAAREDDDNDDEDSGDSLISLLPAGGFNETSGRHGDEAIDVTVDGTEDDERQENHDDKVSNEDVVSAVAKVFPQLCRTNRNFASARKALVKRCREAIVARVGQRDIVNGDASF